MFKTRTIIDTSKRNMVRIEKRERILSAIISCGCLNKLTEVKTVSLSFLNLNDPVISWVIKLIDDTKWLYNKKELKLEDGLTVTTYKDTNKLRIYYKWLFKNNLFTYKRILKYMYSPLFPSLLIMSNGQLKENCLIINNPRIVNFFDMKENDMLIQWFSDILDVKAKNNYGLNISFDQDNTKKILNLCKPYLEQIPKIRSRYF